MKVGVLYRERWVEEIKQLYSASEAGVFINFSKVKNENKY